MSLTICDSLLCSNILEVCGPEPELVAFDRQFQYGCRYSLFGIYPPPLLSELSLYHLGYAQLDDDPRRSLLEYLRLQYTHGRISDIELALAVLDLDTVLNEPEPGFIFSRWALEHWGTECDIFYVKLAVSQHGLRRYCFESVVHPPLDWVRYAIKRWPELSFTLKFLRCETDGTPGIKIEARKGDCDLAGWVSHDGVRHAVRGDKALMAFATNEFGHLWKQSSCHFSC